MNTPVHHDPTAPVFGYQPADPTGQYDGFHRASNALQVARADRDAHARLLADELAEHPDSLVLDAFTNAYRRAKAAHAYATAVYEAEAEKVRQPAGNALVEKITTIRQETAQ